MIYILVQALLYGKLDKYVGKLTSLPKCKPFLNLNWPDLDEKPKNLQPVF